MSKTADFDYDEPWDRFADEEEPWKNLERLLEWRGKLDTQAELGDAFGCTPSTISYWLSKAEDEVEVDPDDEALQCEYHEVCGNYVNAPNNSLCIVCMDLRGFNETVDAGDSEDMAAHIEELYEVHSEYAEGRQAVYDELHTESEDSKNES